MPEYEESRLKRVGKKYGEFAQKFKLDSHHTIERLGVTTAAFAITGMLILSGGSVSAYQSTQADLSTVAAYTTKFVTSRTAQEGAVPEIYVNSDKTKVLVPMSFKEATGMPYNASDYEAYVTGIKGNVDGSPTKINQATVGSIISFGQTGNLAVLLEAPKGFDDQLINITVRAKREVSKVDPSKIGQGYDGLGQSFIDNDQWRVIVNPNGSNAKTLPALDGKTIDVGQVYAQTANREKEMGKRAELDTTMADLKRELDRIEALNVTMAKTSIRVGSDEDVYLIGPKMPDEITGDKIHGLSSTELTNATNKVPKDQLNTVEGLEQSSPAAIQMDVFDQKNPTNSYVLESQHAMPGGVDFNWRAHTVAEGFVDEVVPAGMAPMDYLNQLRKEGMESRRSVRDLPWKLSNGMLVSDLDRSDASLKPLVDLYNNSLQTYDNYYKLKRRYQTQQLRDLLMMEIDVNSVARNSEIVSGDQAVSIKM